MWQYTFDFLCIINEPLTDFIQKDFFNSDLIQVVGAQSSANATTSTPISTGITVWHGGCVISNIAIVEGDSVCLMFSTTGAATAPCGSAASSGCWPCSIDKESNEIFSRNCKRD